MYLTCDDRTDDERCIEILLVKNVGLRVYKCNGKKQEKEWSLANEINSKCSVMDVTADTGMSMVPIVSAS